jgi:RNA polymerase sigma-70 factor (ECF subfamily)
VSTTAAQRREAEEAACIEQARAGDPAAFTRIYRLHVDRVYTRLTRLVGAVPEREDLVQQVFLELFRALPTFRGDATMSTFLHRIALNVAYQHLRRRRRRPTVSLEPEQLEALVAVGLSPEAGAARREQIAQVLGLLDRLSARQRLAFVLVDVEGVGLAEAAPLLGCTPDAVKQRVLHARHELVEMLRRSGHGR